MSRPLTTNAKGWQRIGRVVQEVEGAPLLSTRGRAKYPIAPGGGRGKRVYITQDDGSGNAVPCYSSDAGMTVPFACNSELDGSGTEYEVYWSYQPGVRLTGEAIYIAKRKRPAGNVMQWEPVDAGVSAWPQAVAVGNITSGTGTARITHWGISCEVDVVWFDPTFTVQDGATIYVTFDQESGIFVGHMTSCPPDP